MKFNHWLEFITNPTTFGWLFCLQSFINVSKPQRCLGNSRVVYLMLKLDVSYFVVFISQLHVAMEVKDYNISNHCLRTHFFTQQRKIINRKQRLVFFKHILFRQNMYSCAITFKNLNRIRAYSCHYICI